MTRKEKLAKRKSLVSLARYLVSKAKYKAELLQSREHDRQEAKARAKNPPKKLEVSLPEEDDTSEHTHDESCDHNH